MLADWAAVERSLGRGEGSCEWGGVVGELESQCIVLNKEHHSAVWGSDWHTLWSVRAG